MRRQIGPPRAHPKEVVVVKPAFVPTSLKSGGEAYLVRTWLLQPEKRTYIHCALDLPQLQQAIMCAKRYVITHSSIGSVSIRTGISNGFNRYQQWPLSQL